MHWVVQENLWNETEYDNFIGALERLSIPFDVVKVVPFSHELIPDVNPTGLVMAYGSVTLAKIAKEKGWIPGSFMNENHDFRVWRNHYNFHLLNHQAEVSRFADVTPFWQDFFIRPCEDTKQYSGMVTTWDDFKEWRKRVIDLKETYTTLDATTMVCYGPLKDIWAEFRFFVVDGEVITYSQYKQGDRVVKIPHVDEDVIAFARKMIDIWQPARAEHLSSILH